MLKTQSKKNKKIKKYFLFFYATKKYICIFFALLFISMIIIKKQSEGNRGGWQYVFNEEISQQTADPKEFHTLTLNNLSIYVGVTNGFTYNLNRISGAFKWRHEANNSSIYPGTFGENNLMFLTNFDGNVYAVNTLSGKELWRFTTPGRFMADTEPILSDNLVFFGSRNGFLYALDRYTGNVKWSFQTTPVDISHLLWDEKIIHFGRFTVDDTYIYLNSSTDDTIYALDKKTGKEVWRFAQYGFLFQKPILYPKSISFWNSSGVYYILNKSNGKLLYSTKTSLGQIYQGNTHNYIIDTNNNINSFDTAAGAKLWTYQNIGEQPVRIKEINDSQIIVTNKKNTLTQVTMIDTETGKKTWGETIEEQQINAIQSDTSQIYIIGKSIQCSYDFKGVKKWCSHEKQIGTTSFLTKEGLFLISSNRESTDIIYVNKQTGSRKWIYNSPAINTDVMEEYMGNLYYVSKDKKNLIMLNSKFSQPVIHDADIKKIIDTHDHQSKLSQISQNVKLVFNQLAIYLTPINKNKSAITVDTPNKQVNVHDIYELTLHIDENRLVNKYDNIKITGTFINGKEIKYDVNAFYYDKNTWKLRFNPPTIGEWKFIIRNTIFGNTLNRGSFTVLNSDKPDFIAISKIDPRLFVSQNGNIFTPIGLQDFTVDYNQDGNPLNQWFLGTDSKAPINTISYPTTSLEAYLSSYAQSGFNMFRWGTENCSFPLWKSLSPSRNLYAVNEGAWLDTFFSSLRNNGFHIWMSVFSFTLPYMGDIHDPQTQNSVKSYLEYIVSRYGSYVDVWELANEIKLDDKLIGFMSDYIRSIDPYHHPITTSWERPELSTIDISSIHWYSQECDICHDEDLKKQILNNQKITKPIVFSEQGNWHTNWDYKSAIRMRIRLWVGFFEKMSFIFWNTSRTLVMNRQDMLQGPSNIYLGPTERLYTSIFKTFITNINGALQKYPLVTLVSRDNIYTFISGQQILGYIYRQTIDAERRSASFFVYIPTPGIIQWVDPATGIIILEQTIQKGTQILQSPDFSTDIAFKILPDTPSSQDKKDTFNITESNNPIPVNSVYELTLLFDTPSFINTYDNGDISASFTNEQGNIYHVKAFYFDKNTWKLRFVPTTEGKWKWKITAKDGIKSTSQTGDFTVSVSDIPGFISISQMNPQIFTSQKGNIFIPIGIQECIDVYINDNDPTIQWLMGSSTAADNSTANPAPSLETYISTKKSNGFNMFRWGTGYCNPLLWKTAPSLINPETLNDGVQIDMLFSSLKNHGFHIWMNLSNFLSAFDGSIDDSQKQILLKQYLDYMVSRYSGYIDVWEVTNTGKRDDKLIVFMSDYIRSIDPYHHPITTNSQNSLFRALPDTISFK